MGCSFSAASLTEALLSLALRSRGFDLLAALSAADLLYGC